MCTELHQSELQLLPASDKIKKCAWLKEKKRSEPALEQVTRVRLLSRICGELAAAKPAARVQDLLMLSKASGHSSVAIAAASLVVALVH